MQKMAPLAAHMDCKAKQDASYDVFRQQLSETRKAAQEFIDEGYAKCYEWNAMEQSEETLLLTIIILLILILILMPITIIIVAIIIIPILIISIAIVMDHQSS